MYILNLCGLQHFLSQVLFGIFVAATILTAEPSTVELTTQDIHPQVVNISWMPLHAISSLNHAWSITSPNTLPQMYQTQTPSFMFKAPRDAPPCEVYNFSVTATYVGATYTGDGCSVPSPVLSTMLPSLPDKSMLESSVDYSLVRQGPETVTMRISMKVSNQMYF